MQDQLKNVQQIQSSVVDFDARLKQKLSVEILRRAFAAILEDRSVVMWGHRESGGDSNAVHHQLQNIYQIPALMKLLATAGDGYVVTEASEVRRVMYFN